VATARLGSIVSDIRGSVGDETYSRNQGGIYIRGRVTPTYTNTADQQAVRAAITALSQAWSSTLTDGQRDSWRTYAHSNPRPDAWGQLNLTNGYTAFIRHNATPYRDTSAIAFADAPTAAPLWQPTFTFTADSIANTITIALPILSYDPPPAGLRVYVFGGMPVTPGTNYFSGPWRYQGKNTFTGPWVLDPFTLAYNWPFTAGQKLFVSMQTQDTITGARSTRYVAQAIAS